MRVSDADRDRALSELSEAFQVGRLTPDEFDQRSGQALGARTGKELTALLADLPADQVPADTTALERPDRAPSGVVIGATIAAACFALVAVANALNPGPTLQQRQFFQEMMARQGISVPLPPSPGFNWEGTLTPAAVAVVLVVLIIFLRVTRARRNGNSGGEFRRKAEGGQ